MYYENKNLQPPINLHTNSRKNYKKLDEGILKARWERKKGTTTNKSYYQYIFF